MQTQPAAVPSPQGKRRRPFVGLLVATFGFIVVAIGLAIGIFHLHELAVMSGRATGTVIGYQRTTSSTKSAYRPVVVFTTTTGETQRFTSWFGTSPPRFQIGERVTVAYDPANPSQATIDSFVDNWAIPLGFGGAGLVSLLLGVAAATRR